MNDCAFCMIAQARIPAKTVYRGLHATAFLDIKPLAKGHVLIIPQRHAERIEDLSAEEMANYMAMVPRIVRAVLEHTGAQGATLAWNNGPAAGQEVPHVHLHVIPRYPEDKAGPIHAMFVDRPDPGGIDMDELATRIRKSLGS